MEISKESYRKQALISRNQQNQDEIATKSKKIIDRFIKLDCFRNAKTIFCYLSIGSEVQTYELIEKLLAARIEVCLPFVLPDVTEMSFYSINNLTDHIEEGFLGLKQPNPQKTRKVSPNDADIIIVPGIVFDKRLNRIGYGKGYYDNFLKEIRPEAIKIAFAYDLQIHEDITVDEWDVKMDIIITETKVLSKNC